MNNQQKQQVVEQVKSANNVLVTVSSNPTVDELSASVGLTLALNKLGKHATTVFSGVVPSTIEFLQPEQTIETTTDSLRDFIIALDKSKADKLRYKVEDDVVRIFITPYKTTITDKDLQFSHGDFNVDVVIAIGVTRREDLDRAVTAHGRILHDATVVSITRDVNSELGSLNWQEPQASSLCEMVGSMTLEVQQDVLDGQMATAFLTGIIAETDRFRNEKTTPIALSLSSQLMSSGANQQLIADKLEEPAPPPMPIHKRGEDGKLMDEVSNDGTLSIGHNEEVDIPNDEEQVDKIHIDEHGNLGPHPEDQQGLKLSHEDVNDDYLNHKDDRPAGDMDFSNSDQHDEPNRPAGNEPDHVESKGGEQTLHHEKKVIVPPSEEGKPRTDKPFDLNAAIQAANDEGIPVEAAPTDEEPKEPEPGLPELPEPVEPPQIIQDHSGPMLTEDPTDKDQGLDPVDSSDMDSEAPSGAPPPPLSEAAEHEMPDMPMSSQSTVPAETVVPSPEPSVDASESKTSAATSSSKTGDQTLTDLEKAVDSPHLPPSSVVDDARDAVAKAADSKEPLFPRPKENVGASNVDLQKVAEEVASAEPEQAPAPAEDKAPEVTDPTAPPPVPPPMTTPQFFDADGNNQNPFLNPNGQ